MNTNNANSINTGLAAKINEFKWFHPSSTVHVEGVKYSEPDFTIPPTPASSYSNLHVVLDTVHPSSETIIRGVNPSLFPYGIQQSTLATGQSFSQPLQKPLSPEPASLLRSRGFQSEFKAVPDVIDPEQPGARANESLTSLKSEITPLLPPMVPLDSFDDDLAERTDRALPDTVDIGLVDENSNLPFVDDIRSKNWNLKHQSYGGQYANQWKTVGADINNKNWNLRHQSYGGQFANQWKMVGEDINNQRFNLRHSRMPDSFQIKSWSLLGQLEEAERSRRISAGVDPLWSGRMYQVGREINSSILPVGWSSWLSNLKNKVMNKSMDVIDSAKDAMDSAKDAVRDFADSLPATTSTPVKTFDASFSFGSNADFYSFSFPRQIPYDIIKLEEEERADRIARGVDPILSGKWYLIGRELTHSYGADLAAWFAGFKLRAAKRGRSLLESAKDKSVDLADSINYNGSILMESVKEKSSDFAEFAKDKYIEMNATKAPLSLAATRGADYEYETIDFTFKSRRVPSFIIELEEQERAYRMSRGASPIVLGQFYRLGLELKYKYSLRPTIASSATRIARVASDVASEVADKAGDVLGYVMETGKNLMERATPAPEVDFAEHGDLHLNLFAYTAEPIDFTFKSRRCPQSIIAMEEKERADRIAQGVDVVAYGRWNALLLQQHKTLSPDHAYFAAATNAATGVLSSAKEVLSESSKGWTGLFNSIAHSVADEAHHLADVYKHSHLLDSAKESLGMSSASSLTSVTKAEEAERLRRESAKVDPMTAARIGRVQDELLKTVKSV